jgi:hypothetical protein
MRDRDPDADVADLRPSGDCPPLIASIDDRAPIDQYRARGAEDFDA